MATSIAGLSLWGLLGGGAVSAAAPTSKASDEANLAMRLVNAEATLRAQEEARDRQADAFGAAATRIEIANLLLVLVLGLAGIGGSLLAIRWVRSLAREQVSQEISKAVAETGREIFEVDAKRLYEHYDKQFAELYKTYKKLVDQES